MEFPTNALVSGIPLVLVVLGLVEFMKKVGLAGVWLTVASLLVGVVCGVLYQMSIQMPTAFPGWFGAVIYGLALGLVAAGLYDLGKRYVEKP